MSKLRGVFSAFMSVVLAMGLCPAFAVAAPEGEPAAAEPQVAVAGEGAAQTQDATAEITDGGGRS